MRGDLKPAMATLAALLCGCSGASTPASHSGDSRTPATASTPAPGTPAAPQKKTGPRAHVSDEEARKPRPDLPPDQRALLVTGEPGHPEERWVDAEAAEAAGYTLVDSERRLDAATSSPSSTTPDGQPLPNRYRRVFLGLANDQLDSDGEPLEPGEQELPRALRHLPVAVGAARALRRGRTSTPATIRRAWTVLEAVETVTYVAPNDIKKDERRLATHARGAGEGAPQAREVATLRGAGGEAARAARPR